MSINTNNISINNFNNVCRTCAQTNDLISIKENIYLLEMLSTSVHNLQVQLNDDLPQQICMNCINDLNQSYTFIGKCKAADAAFKQCLTQQKLINLKQNHEKNKPRHEAPEEIYIKTETSVNEECDNCSDSPQYNTEIEDKNQREINNLNKCVTTNNDLKQQLSDCQLENLNETMETEESGDDEDPLDVSTLHEKSQSRYKRERPLFSMYCKENNVKNCFDSPQYKSEIEDKNQFEINNLNEWVTTNNDLKPKLNDCRLNETMETEESGDDEVLLDASALNEKSQSRYKKEHSLFLMYCKENNVKKNTEDSICNYFLEKSITMQPSTLWPLYSMLKKILLINDNIDISKYTKLLTFLKRKSFGSKCNVSKAFTMDQINKFLNEAPDDTFLMIKVAMIMGITGGCRCEELVNMTLNHIEDKGSVLIVTVSTPKTNKSRSFVVMNSESDWLSIYRKYYKRRVTCKTEHGRLFLSYKNGKLSNQPVGVNTFGKFPKFVAEYLKLANPAQYTGRCFKRTFSLMFNRTRNRKPREDSD